MQARWLDLGSLDPLRLYATVEGLAQAQAADGVPVLVWVRADRPHVCLGASQGAAAELDRPSCVRQDLPVLRRPLGGGTVWVDPDQHCFFLIVPRQAGWRRREAFFSRGLAPALQTFRRFGLPAQAVGRGDLWLAGRKILGSGAATVNQADVLGASFLLRFPARRFAQVVRAPSEGYRAWLTDALAGAMTSWSEHAEPP
ncbi:MAG TPA: biotin--protein ligase, partial [Gammaproteobacteria bacterium]|nr:biotin--protein ligase [Gammaproteobacteria bacterium]